jgi:hypothetical protein
LYDKEQNVNGNRTFGLKFYKDEWCTFLCPIIKKQLISNPIYVAALSNKLLLFKLHDQIFPENIKYHYLKDNDLSME